MEFLPIFLAMSKQLSLFENNVDEVNRLKDKVNRLILAINVIESNNDAAKSTGTQTDQDWLEDYCYTVLLENEKEVV